MLDRQTDRQGDPNCWREKALFNDRRISFFLISIYIFLLIKKL